jgi:thiamine biosynthesis lipoprotein
MRLEAARRTVALDAPEMQLDLGGIAKGYAADAALEALRRLGIRRALVAVSGDIVCGEAPPGRRGWRIAADPLGGEGTDQPPVLELSNAAVSTSGDAEQHLDWAGQRYSHIIDPATAFGLTRGIGVTVTAPKGIWADGLATAVSLIGAARGISLIDQRRDTAALIALRENGTTRLIESNLFRKLARETAIGRQ